MSDFDIANAKDRGGIRYPFFSVGGFQGVCVVTGVHENPSTARKGAAYVVDFKVATSNLPEYPVDSSFTWYANLATAERAEYALPEIKQFLLSAMNPKTPEDKAKSLKDLNAFFKASSHANQPLKGAKVRIITSLSKGGFCKLSFAAI